jgi:hypothetical protein
VGEKMGGSPRAPRAHALGVDPRLDLMSVEADHALAEADVRDSALAHPSIERPAGDTEELGGLAIPEERASTRRLRGGVVFGRHGVLS